MTQLPTIEALYLGDVLLLPLPLLSRRCQSRILLLFLDSTSFAATSRLGQSCDLFLTKSRPQFFPIQKTRPAQYALDKCLPILGDCVKCGPYHQFLIRRGPYGSQLVTDILQLTEENIYLFSLLHLV